MSKEKPIRVQRQRGVKFPPNTVFVGIKSEFENPYENKQGLSSDEKIKLFLDDLIPYSHHGAKNSLQDFFLSKANIDWISKLKGKNLACWCPLDQKCHADILLELANDEGLHG